MTDTVRSAVHRRRCGSILVASLLIGTTAACVAQTERDRGARAAAPRLAPLPSARAVDPRSASIVSQRAEAALRDATGGGFLPQWKTAGERQLETRRATGMTAIDQFDDYRKQNAAKFYITKAPQTAIRMPAEYEPSQGYLLAWEEGLGAARDQIYSEMIKAAWGVVPLILVHNDAKHRQKLESALTGLGLDSSDATRVQFAAYGSNSIWVRDWGPVSVVEVPSVPGAASKIAFVDFRYYHGRVRDDHVPTDLAQTWGINTYRPDLSFEGGNLMATTDGLCAASSGVLDFNPQFAQSAVEETFAQYLGCKKSVFPQPLDGEGTTHIDMFAKFASDTEVVVGEYQATQDATNKQVLDAVAALFAATTNGSGQPLKVVRMPMPDNKKGNGRIWRTHTNSQALAGAGGAKVLLIPVYSDETSAEEQAMTAYAQVFPGWKLVKIDSKAIIGWGGAMHCITMQVPLGVRAKIEADPADKCGPDKLACDDCGHITGAGCCAGNTVKYCNSEGRLLQLSCANKPQCGWDATNRWYDCGTNGDADPGGRPLSCDVVTDGGAPDGGHDGGGPSGKPCGKVPKQGCCDGQKLLYCEKQLLKEINCAAAPSCGWKQGAGFYDCNTTGGADPSGKLPLSCASLLGDAGPGNDDGGVGCGDIPEQGCCSDEGLKTCVRSNAGDRVHVESCAGRGPCGWSAEDGVYRCNTAGAAEPSGAWPLRCVGQPMPDGSAPLDAASDAGPDGAEDASADALSQGSQAAATGAAGGGSNGCGVAAEALPAAHWLWLALLGLLIAARRGRPLDAHPER